MVVDWSVLFGMLLFRFTREILHFSKGNNVLNRASDGPGIWLG